MNKYVSGIIVFLGFIAGIYFPELAMNLSFLGELFLSYLKMLIIPIVFVSIFLAIAKLKKDDLKSIGSKTALFYLCTSFFAGLTGFLVSKFFTFNSFVMDAAENGDNNQVASLSFGDMLLGFMPKNIFESLSNGSLVHIVVFSLLAGFATLFINKESQTPLVDLAESADKVLNILIGWGLVFAPIGISSLIAKIIAQTDLSIFKEVIPLFWAIGTSSTIHMFITLPILGYLVGKFNPFKFMLAMRKPLATALVTASSSATLPVSIKTLDDSGEVKEKTSGFVLPLGATLNMDGSALYQTLVIFFLAQVAGISLDVTQQIMVIILVMVSSAGSAGIPAGGMVMVVALMGMLGIPSEYVALYVLVDRFWDYPITMVNVCGDLFAARSVDRFIK